MLAKKRHQAKHTSKKSPCCFKNNDAGATKVLCYSARKANRMPNSLDLIKIRKAIEAMTAAECWEIQKESMNDAGKYWEKEYGNLLGAILIYCGNTAEVMGATNTLSVEEKKELKELGNMVAAKWKQGQKGENNISAKPQVGEKAVKAKSRYSKKRANRRHKHS